MRVREDVQAGHRSPQCKRAAAEPLVCITGAGCCVRRRCCARVEMRKLEGSLLLLQGSMHLHHMGRKLRVAFSHQWPSDSNEGRRAVRVSLHVLHNASNH